MSWKIGTSNETSSDVFPDFEATLGSPCFATSNRLWTILRILTPRLLVSLVASLWKTV